MKTRALTIALLAAALVPGVAGGAEDTPPETTITSGPADPVASSSASFTFTSDQPGSRFGCALDRQSFRACSSPKTYAGLSDGVHTFFVFALNNGMSDPTPASWTWTIDTVPPPPVTGLRASVSYRRLVLSWTPSGDTDHVVILRSTDAKNAASAQVYQGPGGTYAETKFVNAGYHHYSVTSYDKAGNVSAPVDVTVPASALLLAPADGASMTAPPTLLWRGVPSASYYNVQLWRGTKKILSAWPHSPKFKVSRTWRFQAYRFHFKPGTYTWYVWPAFGPGKKATYGQLLGTASFQALR
ncbi:MAG: hypothetical protein WBB76_10910 [Gaiellaceae bacterium]